MRLDLNGLGDSPSRRRFRENDTYPTGAGETSVMPSTCWAPRCLARVACRSVLWFGVGVWRRRCVAKRSNTSWRSTHDWTSRSTTDPTVAFAPEESRPTGSLRHSAEEDSAVPDDQSNPAPIWRALSAAPRASAYLGGRGAPWRGTAVSFVFGPTRWGLMAMQLRAPRHWAQLEASPKVSVTRVDALDHSMFVPEDDGAKSVLRTARHR